MIRTQDAQQALVLLRKGKRILCVCHHAPDGDALGALLGMGLLLERHLPEIPCALFCIDVIPEVFRFLPAVHRVQSSLVLQSGDVLLFLDCAEPKLTGYHASHPEIFLPEAPSIVIDHHVSNPGFGSVNIIVPQASSTCELIVHLAAQWSWTIDAESATCLLMGIATDTGGFLHSNTTARVYRIAAELLRRGARHQRIVSAMFRTAKMSTLKLWGRVLEKITVSTEGGAISAVTEGDFRATGAEYSELSGAIDYVNAIPGMRFSLILSERGGNVKGSLRTLCDDVDVNVMAGRLHGGGHQRAAGFALQGRLQPEIRWKVVPERRAHPAAGGVSSFHAGPGSSAACSGSRTAGSSPAPSGVSTSSVGGDGGEDGGVGSSF